MKKVLIFLTIALSVSACGSNNSSKKSEESIQIEGQMGVQSVSDPSMNMDSYQSKYGGKKCSVQGPHDSVPCKCYGFSASNSDPSKCVRCGHHATKHTRR